MTFHSKGISKDIKHDVNYRGIGLSRTFPHVSLSEGNKGRKDTEG